MLQFALLSTVFPLTIAMPASVVLAIVYFENRAKIPLYTIGEEIRNENVTPSGSPTLVKPINNGMDEQEQKGVTVPSKADMTYTHRCRGTGPISVYCVPTESSFECRRSQKSESTAAP